MERIVFVFGLAVLAVAALWLAVGLTRARRAPTTDPAETDEAEAGIQIQRDQTMQHHVYDKQRQSSGLGL